MRIDIPTGILQAIDRGECTLFLGAGASAAAGAPAGSELSDLVCEQLLEQRRGNVPLELAASLVCSETGQRPNLESLIVRQLENLNPTMGHLRIPWFRWRAIVTTNYDQLIESAYEHESGAIQRIVKTLKEHDLVNEPQDARTLPLLKPHGCISQPDSMAITLEDIYRAKHERRLLFQRIEMLHLLGPVIYVGYSLKDAHILDSIFDLTDRLGEYRRPILFVTLQRDRDQVRAQQERQWFEHSLRGSYLACGFDSLMEYLTTELTPPIASSFIVRDLAPCRVSKFAGNGKATYEIKQEKETWECWFTYCINHEEGFAGIVFERIGAAMDARKFRRISFELNVPTSPRCDPNLEAPKLESSDRLYRNLLDTSDLPPGKWVHIEVPLDSFDIDKADLWRVVFADNGHRAELGQEYKLGIRRVKFA